MNINISLKESKSNLKQNNNMNNNIKRPMDESVQDAVNFFNNEANLNLDNFDNNDFLLGNNNYTNNIELNNKIKELNLEIQRLKDEYNLNEQNYIQEINSLKQKNDIKGESETIIKNLKEKYQALENEYQNEKTKLKKENQKLKKDNENLIKLCSQLKIEVNRLENSLSIAQNYIEEANKLNNDINNINNMNNLNDYESEINLKEIDDIKKKTQELIEAKPFNREHFIEPSKIKQQAKDTIEKVMREKINDNNFYSSINSNNNYNNMNNFNNNEIEDDNNFNSINSLNSLNNDIKLKEENKEMEGGRDNSFNSAKLKLLKRTKRK